jgi:hypothetical protein
MLVHEASRFFPGLLQVPHLQFDTVLTAGEPLHFWRQEHITLQSSSLGRTLYATIKLQYETERYEQLVGGELKLRVVPVETRSDNVLLLQVSMLYQSLLTSLVNHHDDYHNIVNTQRYWADGAFNDCTITDHHSLID